jgi:transposase InsO family protein
VKFAHIQAECREHAVSRLCRLLSVSTSGYYAWRDRPGSQHARDDGRLGDAIQETFYAHRRRYGSPRIHADLRAAGQRTSRKRVARLMRNRGLAAHRPRPFKNTTDSNHKYAIAPNLLNRRFTSDAPNTVWVTDVTAIKTSEGWVYYAAIIDLFSRRAVGLAASDTNDTRLALDALEMAVRDRKPATGLIHHSDRGSPYASDEYRDALSRIGAVRSMSRRGDCWDNAPSESFFATVKKELPNHGRHATRHSSLIEMQEFIEQYYNVARRHSSIGHLSPVEFERRHQLANTTS